MSTQGVHCTLDKSCPKCKMFCGLRKDRELIKQLHRGNGGAFTKLVEQHSPMLKKFFRNRQVSNDQIDDLVNKVYVVVIQDILDFVWTGKPLEWWIRSIARRVAQAWARERKNNEHVIYLDDIGLSSGDGAALSVEGDFYNEHPANQSDNSTRKDRLVHLAIKQLPPLQGDIVTLIYFEGISRSQEVADRLNMTYKTPGKITATNVRVNHMRALKRLQLILSQDLYSNQNATRAWPLPD